MAHPVTAPLIAITGTNGKSTTTALVGHVLGSSGLDVQVGGNIGTAVLDLEAITPERFFVLELSSYQIDLTPSLDPTFSVLLNISPDHIDRHGTFENYAAVKARIIENCALAIVGVDHDQAIPGAQDACLQIADRRRSSGLPLVVFTRQPPSQPGILHGQSGYLVRASQADGFAATPGNVVDLSATLTLKGAHNLENAAAAFLVSEFLGLAHDEIAASLKTFPGLAHRMELVGRAAPVLYFNDSKATNADSADKALAAFDRDIFWIAGGLAKDGGIESLAPHFSKVSRAFLIGDSADAFAETIGSACPVSKVGTIEAAVAAASKAAAASSGPEPVVLLSPACASFDQFRNFELRGDAFRQAVSLVDGVQMIERASL